MMRRVLTAAAAVLLGCQVGGDETRTFELQYLEPEAARTMIEPYVPGGAEHVRVTERPASLTVTAPGVRVEQVAQVLRTYDVAQPDVQLRFQIIEADGFTGVDPAIADVQAALQDLFRFRGYRLVGEAVVRARAPNNLSQRVATGAAVYTIQAQVARVISADGGKAAELSVLLESGGTPAGGRLTLLSTSLTVPSGQTVVVGSAQQAADGSTLILVVRPQIQ